MLSQLQLVVFFARRRALPGGISHLKNDALKMSSCCSRNSTYLSLLWLHVGEVAVVVDVPRLLQVCLVPRVALGGELALLADPDEYDMG